MDLFLRFAFYVMKISQNLPQFENKKTLFVVAGEQEAIFYIAHKNEIKQQESWQMSKPKELPQKEGFFVRRGRGITLGTGSVFEPRKKKLRDDFVKRITDDIKKIISQDRPEEIYLFAPAQIRRYIKNNLPQDIRQNIQATVRGNYTNKHPFDLIKQIARRQNKKPALPMSEEAKKLLEKTRQAGKFWRK